MSWRCSHVDKQKQGNKQPSNQATNHIFTLEEFWLLTTMLITLKLVVKDQNDYIFFGYYGQICNGHLVVVDMTWMSRQLHPNRTIVTTLCHVVPTW